MTTEIIDRTAPSALSLSSSTHLRASSRPVEVIEKLARRPDQPANFRSYMPGFEGFFNQIPTLEFGDPLLDLKTELAGAVLKNLSTRLTREPWIYDELDDGEFARHILAIEEPTFEPVDESLAHLMVGDILNLAGGRRVLEAMTPVKEGSEILVAHWGKGFSSPVHGHAPGLLHEDILSGKILVNTYRRINKTLVRPVRSDVVGKGLLVSRYNPPDPTGPRTGLIHNFVAATPAVSLHFVAEHTRDGRDNGFKVERFHVMKEELQQITSDEGLKLRIGDVALVRSTNVADHGDHFIVITGAPTIKDHGLRPADVAIHAPNMAEILDSYEPHRGLVLLKLSPDATSAFFKFHDITKGGPGGGPLDVAFPET